MYAEKPKPINKYLQATDSEIAEVELDRRFEELYGSIEKLDDKIHDRIGDLTFRQEDVECCIDDAQEDIIDLNNEVVELRGTVEDLQDTIQELQDKLEELTNEWRLWL